MLLPILHSGYSGPFLAAWSFDPIPVIGLLLAAFLYGLALQHAEQAGRRLPPTWQIACYYLGLVSVAIALVGPLDVFNDELFFLHMSQHLMLMQVSAPLILLGRPVQVFLRGLPPSRSGPVLKAVLRPSGVRWFLNGITNPLVAFFLFNGVMIFWHLPKFYDAALEDGPLHDFEHLCFFVTALIYWWALIDPVPRHHKLPTLWALASLFFTMIVGSALGAILTLSKTVIYPFYLNVYHPWGLSALVDQQIGGLIMWVGGGLLYTLILLVILAKALNLDEEETERAEAMGAPPPLEPSPDDLPRTRPVS